MQAGEVRRAVGRDLHAWFLAAQAEHDSFVAKEAVQEANERAKRLIEEAKESAVILSEKKTQEASAEAKGIIAKAEEAARGEKDKMHADLKREFGRLVANTTAQVTGKVLNDDDQQRINEEAMAEVES